MPTLNWHKREEAVRAATRAPYRLLELVTELCYGDADSESYQPPQPSRRRVIQHGAARKPIKDSRDRGQALDLLRFKVCLQDRQGLTRKNEIKRAFILHHNVNA
jgi:hypothetical protein